MTGQTRPTLTPAAERVVATYLDDLGRMLEPSTPHERAEVLGQVREHIDAALAEVAVPANPKSADSEGRNVASASVEQVEAVLNRLGAPERIVTELSLDTTASSASAQPAWSGLLGQSGHQSWSGQHLPPSRAASPGPYSPQSQFASDAASRAANEAGWRGLVRKPWLPWLIVGLMASSLIPGLGWIAALFGVVLFLASPLWGTAAKVCGAIAYFLPLLAVPAMGLLAWTALSTESTGSGTVADSAEVFLPASYDVSWSLLLALPLWLTVVAVVMAFATRKSLPD